MSTTLNVAHPFLFVKPLIAVFMAAGRLVSLHKR